MENQGTIWLALLIETQKSTYHKSSQLTLGKLIPLRLLAYFLPLGVHCLIKFYDIADIHPPNLFWDITIVMLSFPALSFLYSFCMHPISPIKPNQCPFTSSCRPYILCGYPLLGGRAPGLTYRNVSGIPSVDAIAPLNNVETSLHLFFVVELVHPCRWTMPSELVYLICLHHMEPLHLGVLAYMARDTNHWSSARHDLM